MADVTEVLADKLQEVEITEETTPVEVEEVVTEDVQTRNPACRVFVGNLAYSVYTAELEEFMSKAGKVKSCEVFEYSGGRSKGSGIVEFETPEEAAVAKETLQDQELNGRKIFLREDREAEKGSYQATRAHNGPSRGRGRGRGGMGSTRPYVPSESTHNDNPAALLYVGNLNYTVSWQDLKDHFRESGFEVVRTDILGNSEGYSRGAGTVLLPSPELAVAAIEKLHNTEFRGRPMDVHL
eukprot:Ihof_evm1s795 gene=Ihof_evmTU1s795